MVNNQYRIHVCMDGDHEVTQPFKNHVFPTDNFWCNAPNYLVVKEKRQNLVCMDVDHEVTLRLHNHSTIMYFQQPVGFEFLSCRTRRNIKAHAFKSGENELSPCTQQYTKRVKRSLVASSQRRPQGLEAACDKRTVGPHLSTLIPALHYIYYYQHILKSEYEKKIRLEEIIMSLSSNDGDTVIIDC